MATEVRKTQPLQQRQPIVDPNSGQPSDYFMKYIALHGGAIVDLDNGLVAKADKTTQIIAGVGLAGGGDLSANRTIDLEDTAVTPGIYGDSTNAVIVTVDQQGRITAISTAPISGGGGSSGVYAPLSAGTTPGPDLIAGSRGECIMVRII